MADKNYFLRYGEPALGLLSGAIAEPLAGWAGLLAGGDANKVEATRHALTYQPRTDEGRAGQQAMANALSAAKRVMVDENPPVRMALDGYNNLADRAGAVSPLLGAAMQTAPAAVGLLAGPGSSVTRAAISTAGRDVAKGAVSGVKAASDNAMAGATLRGPMARQDGIFAGHLSKTADHAALTRAKGLLADGVPDEQIHAQTGWFNGMPDKQWRYEIPDNAAAMTNSRLPTTYIDGHGDVEAWRMGDGLKHDPLYEAYPSIKNIENSFTTEPGADASYRSGMDWVSYNTSHKTPLLSDAQKARIAAVQKPFEAFQKQPHVVDYERQLSAVLDDNAAYDAAYARLGGSEIDGQSEALYKAFRNVKNAEQANPAGGIGLSDKSRSTTLHELQHAVQERENFARGGSADSIARNPLEYASADDIEYAKSLPAYDRATDKDAFVRSFAQMRLGDPRDVYQRLAGEAEARLVQSRMNMTPAELAASYPPSMFDVPADKQIVRFK